MRLLLLVAVFPPVFAAEIHHISLHGQSLCVGLQGAPALSTSQPYTNKRLSATGFAMTPLIEGGAPDYVESPGSGMANQITFLAPGRSFLVEKIGCVSSSPYSALKKGTSPYDNWVAAMQAAPATAAVGGLTYRYAGGLIVHGESDYSNSVTGAAYAGYIAEWQNDVKNDVAATGTSSAPMLVSQMSTWSAYNAAQPLVCPYAACGSQPRGVPLGQLDAARNNPGKIYFLGPKYYLPYADSLHLTSAGYLRLGELAGKAWKRILVDRAYWTGLVPRSISISGPIITFRAWVPAGSLTLDTTTLPDATYCQGVAATDPTVCTSGGGVWAVHGFEYYDESGTSKPHITAVSITSSDTITITLSAAPTAANRRLRYAFTGFGKFPAGAATAPHGNIRDNDPTIGVTSGAPLYDWLATFDDPIGFAWSPPKRALFPLPSPRGR